MDKREIQLKISQAIGKAFEEIGESNLLGVTFVLGVYVSPDSTGMSGGVVVRNDVDEIGFSKLTRDYFLQMRDDSAFAGDCRKGSTRAN